VAINDALPFEVKHGDTTLLILDFVLIYFYRCRLTKVLLRFVSFV